MDRQTDRPVHSLHMKICLGGGGDFRGRPEGRGWDFFQLDTFIIYRCLLIVFPAASTTVGYQLVKGDSRVIGRNILFFPLLSN